MIEGGFRMLVCGHAEKSFCAGCVRKAMDLLREKELQIQELRKACHLALRCIGERCLESLIPPGGGGGLCYTGIAADAHDAIEKALGPVTEKRVEGS